MTRFSLLLLLLSSFSAAAGQVLLKIGANGREQLIAFINLPIIFGLLLYVLGAFFWVYVLSYESLVNVYAFTMLTFALVYLGGVFIVGEKITIASFIGIIFILLGLYMISNYNQ